MAIKMTRNASKGPKSGVVPPVEGFCAADRRQFVRPSDRVNLHGLQRRKPLKDIRLPAASLLLSAQIHADHRREIKRPRP